METGKLAGRFEAASLVAIPYLEDAADTHRRIVEGSMGGQPVLGGTIETAFGEVAVVLIPVVDMQLFDDRSQSVKAALAGVRFAAEHGARCVSATGMIPAATHGLQDVWRACQQSGLTEQYPALRLTTGHETVTAAFVFNIERLLEVSGRRFEDEHVTFVGLGHIGSALLRLLFELGRQPASLRLIDVHKKADHLRGLAALLSERFTYDACEVVTIPRGSGVPADIYPRTTLFLSATSAPEVIDVEAMEPGTMCVDDSFPLGFDALKATERLKDKRDILITIAGGLASERPLETRFVLTGDPAIDALVESIGAVAVVGGGGLTGCIYSAALNPHLELPCSLGKVVPKQALSQYRTLDAHGFNGTSVYIIRVNPAVGGGDAYFVSQETLEHFRREYGGQQEPA